MIKLFRRPRPRLAVFVGLSVVVAWSIAACGSGAGASGVSGATSKATKDLIFASDGGTFQQAEDKAQLQPCATKYGLKLINATTPTTAQVEAAKQSGSVQWDIVEAGASIYPSLVQDKLLLPIDYKAWDKATLSQVPAADRQTYGVAALTYDEGIGYRTNVNGGKHPNTWQEFWNTKAFPGPRAIPSGAYPFPDIWMAALLADGVAPNDLYPINFSRALQSLDKIKSHVAVWNTTAAQSVDALVSGQVNYAIVPNGRILQVSSQGGKVGFDYNDAFEATDYYVVPKGAPDEANAMKCIGYIESEQPSIAFMKAIAYGVPNTAANAELVKQDPKYAAMLPTSPENASKGIQFNFGWWAGQGPNSESRAQYALSSWNAWFS